MGSVQLPTNFNLNLKWYEIDEVKDLIVWLFRSGTKLWGD
ncbi:hypothetical protein P344_03545 [Spiroplasma mirum ATCC 29335]|uniref:Uncharacterized protein n=1 Tax=Spiroplasma mirum ATCC 29335 TaxID=838561 RepID=W6AMV1_9MOLU|nr:hypothetical protein P344_03545 [Spiroplasma mirum ATCC 29335]